MRRTLRICLAITLSLLCSHSSLAGVVYVSTSGNDVSSGASWALAKRSVQAGINAAATGDQIWVAKGIYYERITLRNAIGLYGGFAGTETSLGQRDPEDHLTVLDGQQLGTVVRAPLGVSRSAVIDGFNVINGVGNFMDAWGHFVGGGFVCNGSPTISNNVIIGNKGHHGGGIYCDTGSPAIVGNRIESNTTTGQLGDGGGISCHQYTLITGNYIANNHTVQSGGGISSGGWPTIENNTIVGNTTQIGGGAGISFWGDYAIITGNTVTGNTAGGYHGGGISCFDNASAEIADCIVTNNTTAWSGGGIFIQRGVSQIRRCTIKDNISQGPGPDGGGGVILAGGDPLIADCTISGNQAINGPGGGVLIRSTSSPSILRCWITDNYSGQTGGGVNVAAGTAPSPARISHCLIARNTSAGEGGGVSTAAYLRFNNNTVVENQAGLAAFGGGVAIYSNVANSHFVLNSIIAFNSSGLRSVNGTAHVVQDNCVYGNSAFDYQGLSPGVRNISVDPLFRNWPGQDYGLKATSPCVDTGENGWVSENEKDLAGNPRIVGPKVDRGALEFMPGKVVSVSLNPASVVGGVSSQGTVQIDSAAPAGGVVVSLSSDKSAASPPVSVTILQGATSAVFTVTTTPVLSGTVATITGATVTGAASGLLTVNPPAVSSVTISPNSVYGGVNTLATVTLSGKAPTGGLEVLLSSDHAAAVVPAKVTVLAGATSANFVVTTNGVAAKVTAIIKAQFGAGFKTAALQIYPAVPYGITFNPAQVRGGLPVVATLKLSGKAPVGGLVVALEGLQPTIAKPDVASVTVPAGQTSANFGVTTYPVVSLSIGVIKATANGKNVQIGLRVHPSVPRIISFSANPVYGGTPVTATLTLASPAPVGGLSVALASQNTFYATVPSSVTVLAGQMTATFPVQTYGVSSQVMAIITATANGTSVAYGLRLYPAVPLSLKYAPNPVKGGSPATATLTLNGLAPPGGLTVALTALNPAVATCPASVIVPAGQKTANFTVTTKAVTSNQSAVFKATANGVAVSATLTVVP